MNTDVNAYLIATRRTAIGRPGGLHARRRIESLTAPVIEAALQDAGLPASRVDELIIGNTTEATNPARLIGLAAGLPDTTPAMTINRDACSGLDAILEAVHLIQRGEAAVVVAGGAESISTANWRVAKPSSPNQPPRFVDLVERPGVESASGEPNRLLQAIDNVAREHQVQRTAQDLAAAKMGELTRAAYDADVFANEIVALAIRSNEKTDEAISALTQTDQLLDLPTLDEQQGSATTATVAHPHDAASIAILVDEDTYDELGRPWGLKLISSAKAASGPGAEANAPNLAVNKLFGAQNGLDRARMSQIELSEASYGQMLAFADTQQFQVEHINPNGGDISLGHSLGASGAVLVTRLFHDLRRHKPDPTDEIQLLQGLTVAGASSGIAVAALFEATN